jgi:hypothetical protein
VGFETRFTWPFVLATMSSTAVPTSRFMLLKSPSTFAAVAGLVMNLTGAMLERCVCVCACSFERGVLNRGGLIWMSMEWNGAR